MPLLLRVLLTARRSSVIVGWLACGLVIGVRSAVGLAFITFAVVVVTSFVRVSNWRAWQHTNIRVIYHFQADLMTHLLLCSSMTSPDSVSDAHACILPRRSWSLGLVMLHLGMVCAMLSCGGLHGTQGGSLWSPSASSPSKAST